jgi:ABC-type glutathione transport system ATPase component
MSNPTTALPGAPLRVEHLSRYFGRGRVTAALEDVSREFAAGSFTALLGTSGSGKTTLRQCAAGLERPSSAGVSHWSNGLVLGLVAPMAADTPIAIDQAQSHPE